MIGRTMDTNRLFSLPLKKQLNLLATRRDLLLSAWPYESAFLRVFAFAQEVLQDEKAGETVVRTARAFMDMIVCCLLTRPGDVLLLCNALPEDSRSQFMDELAMNKLTSTHLLAAIVSDRELFSRFPQQGGWIGHAIFLRGSMLAEDNPGKKFEIEELIPLGVDVDRASSRALLGSAFDEEQLTEGALKKLLELFPNDRYLIQAIQKR
ncbi:MAG TPA: hypothetical protein VEU33_31315 [Archangium sp.]|nr:hypothetical protein [Archangium sp.]